MMHRAVTQRRRNLVPIIMSATAPNVDAMTYGYANRIIHGVLHSALAFAAPRCSRRSLGYAASERIIVMIIRKQKGSTLSPSRVNEFFNGFWTPPGLVKESK